MFKMPDSSALKKSFSGLKKYLILLPIILLGIIFMCIPSGKNKSTKTAVKSEASADYSLELTESKMEKILASVSGVGKVKVMLCLDTGVEQTLAEDIERERSNDENFEEIKETRETVKISSGSSVQEVVVLKRTYPTYKGALVVCEGADKASIRLDIVNAVSALTDLPADKIKVCRMS